MSRIASRYVTTAEGFERPWEHLADLVPGLQARSHLLGGAYVAGARISASDDYSVPAIGARTEARAYLCGEWRETFQGPVGGGGGSE